MVCPHPSLLFSLAPMLDRQGVLLLWLFSLASHIAIAMPPTAAEADSSPLQAQEGTITEVGDNFPIQSIVLSSSLVRVKEGGPGKASSREEPNLGHTGQHSRRSLLLSLQD